MRPPRDGAAHLGIDESGQDTAIPSTEAPLPQVLASLGWTVERPSRLTLKLSKAGSTLFSIEPWGAR